MEGEYSFRLTKTHCGTQNYYLGRDLTPFASLEMDPYIFGVLSSKDALNYVTTYSVAEDYRSAMVAPDGASSESLLNARGNVILSINSRNQISEYTRDGLGRVVEERMRFISDPENVWHTKTTYQYDDIGNQVQVTAHPRTDAIGTPLVGQNIVTRSFFDDSRWPRSATKQIGPRGYAVVNKYDADGQVTEQIGPFLDNTPDISSDDPTCATSGISCSQNDYNGPFKLASETRVKSKDNTWRTTSYTYDPADHYQLKSATVTEN